MPSDRARARALPAAGALPQEVSAGYRLDAQVGFLLRKAHQRHTSIFAQTMPLGLTPTQFSALVKLAEAGPCSQNYLGRLIAVDVATIKGVVDRLKARGLVAAGADPDDRRRSLLRLTADAAGMIEVLQLAGRTITEKTMEPLSAAERRHLLALLEKLAE
ncbi:MAG: MarR family transcriptional regulator [Sneathiellaceae bacterium]